MTHEKTRRDILGAAVPTSTPSPPVRYRLLCRAGHYENTTEPFTILIPSGIGNSVARIHACRACWIGWLDNTFGMRVISDDDEARSLEAEIGAAETIKKEGFS